MQSILILRNFESILQFYTCPFSDDNADNISLEDYEDAEIEKVDLKKTKKRKDSYDFVQSSQMHGN